MKLMVLFFFLQFLLVFPPFFSPLLAQLCQLKVHFCCDCSCSSTWATVPTYQCQGEGSVPRLRKVRLKKTRHRVVNSFSLFFFSYENNRSFTPSILHHLKAVTPLVVAWGLRKVRKTTVKNRYGFSWDLWLGAPQSASRQIDPPSIASNQ